MKSSPLVILTLLTAVALPAQQTIVVTGGGPALQAAIDGARAGDTLDVRPGTYSPIVVPKGIAIRFRAGAVVSNPGTSGQVVDIAGLPAGESAALTGGAFDLPSGLFIAYGIRVRNCHGAVSIDAPRFTGVGRSHLTNPVDVATCTGSVFIRGLDIGDDYFQIVGSGVSHSTNVSFQGCAKLPLMQVQDSNVSFVASSIPPRNAAQALRISRSHVSITGGVIQSGFMFSFPTPIPGVFFDGGRLTLAGAATVRDHSGNGQAIETHAAGEIRVAPSVTLSGPITGPATVVREPVPSATASGVPAGSVLRVMIAARPGSLTATFVGLPIAPIDLPLGDLWLHPTSPALDVATVPANGTRTVSTVISPIPARTQLTLQPISLLPSGRVVVGAGTRVLLD